jgi:hypothetical protein
MCPASASQASKSRSGGLNEGLVDAKAGLKRAGMPTRDGIEPSGVEKVFARE